MTAVKEHEERWRQEQLERAVYAAAYGAVFAHEVLDDYGGEPFEEGLLWTAHGRAHAIATEAARRVGR
jgi:hypothetical protein